MLTFLQQIYVLWILCGHVISTPPTVDHKYQQTSYTSYMFITKFHEK